MLYEKDKDFVRFQRVHTSQNLYHLWKVPSSATELKLIHFIVKSLTLVPQNVQQTCSYCGQFFKDVFLDIVTSCQTTLEIRNTFLEFIVDYFTPQFSVYVTDLEHEELLCLLIGQEISQTKFLKRKIIKSYSLYQQTCCKQFYNTV